MEAIMDETEVKEAPQPTKTLADLSLTELKSCAYDELALIEAHQRNLQALNAEIVRRGQGMPPSG